MHLLPVSLVLFTVLQGQAQQGGSQQTAGAALTRASFSANGLANERLLTTLYLGNFRDIDLERSDVLFLALYSDYLKAFGRRCDAYLPKNKVELKETYCAQEAYNVDRYGNSVPASSCLVYSTRGTGIYADPTLYAAKEQLDSAVGPDMIQNVFRSMSGKNPLGTALSTWGATEAMTNDMAALLRINACDSPGLKRFQENLMLFALNKQPIVLPGATPSVTSASPPLGPGTFTDQNYTRLLEDLIGQQAKTWAFNQYVPGSTSNVVVSSRDVAGRPLKIFGKYLFNGRNPGSVTVDFADGVPRCIYFFDSPSTCKTPDRTIVAAYSSGNYGHAETSTSSAASRPAPTATTPAPGASARPLQAAPGTTARGSATTVPPASFPAGGQRIPPAPSSGPAAPNVRPTPSADPVNAPASAAPALTPEQQRQQRAAEIQKRQQKFMACVATFQQGLKDHPEARDELVKEYTSCIQAK